MKKALWVVFLFFIAGIVCVIAFNKKAGREPVHKSKVQLGKTLLGKTDVAIADESAEGDDDLAEAEREIKSWGLTEKKEKYERKWYLVQRDGADAKVTFHVRDSNGQNVSGASIHVTFTKGQNTEREGMTDESGMFTAEGKTAWEIGYHVEKEGYYETTYTTYNFFKQEGADFTGGKWQPWNPTITITLKEKRNPIPMYMKSSETKMPIQNEAVGYDFEKGDWIHPHGRGDKADIYMQYKEEIVVWGKTVKRDLTISVPNGKDGLFLYEKELATPLFSIYEAEDVNYQNKINFTMEWKDGQLIQDTQLGKMEYLIFRVHTETDKDGNITSAYYGKIDGPLEFGIGREKYVRFTYYFNPTPNDRNLEYGSNLFGR
jgi:hypothetical protein